ncbi:MobA/MobL family protein [Roseovarius mucosus]|uniref:MobA/MobL family protein n=1 Tax=Roseovarius mucosus TaxID=215743 RepID=A0A1V0RRI8_9RHOB|nr:MobA/MobL family protein [Roseovarius mucosus]ARE84384.1 MobA/MobL family protein [Roseovarius mucosus]
MGFLTFNIGMITRSSGGSATGRSAFQRCVKSECGTHDYSSKRDECILHEVMLPESVKSRFRDPAILWLEAEKMEGGSDSLLGRTIEISIPDKVPLGLWRKFAQEILFPYVDHGFAVEYGIHRTKVSSGNNDNISIHALVSARRMGKEGFLIKGDRYFERKFLRKGCASMIRKITAEAMNFFFFKNGIKAFVDHEKNEAGDDLAPIASDHIIQEIKRETQGLKKHIEEGATPSSYMPKFSLAAGMFLLSQSQKKNGLDGLCEAVGDLDEMPSVPERGHLKGPLL